MRDLDRQQKEALDRHITGNYGADQEREPLAEEGLGDIWAPERELFVTAAEELADIGVQLGEWVADQTLGDPLLRPAMAWAHYVSHLCQIGAVLLVQAEKDLPQSEVQAQDSGVSE